MFQYSPLDHGSDSIRIITVLPDLSHSGLVQCSMKHTTTKQSRYTCLSYEWGLEVSSGGTILIDGKPFRVRQNLLRFLEVAREQPSKAAMWIDAICIDQANTAERSHQVHLMGKIYSGAAEVWIWLGHDFETTGSRTRAIKYPPRNPAALNTTEWGVRENWWTRICNNTYWSRAWITQEIALARKVRLMTGTAEVVEADLPAINIPPFNIARRLSAGEENLTTLLYTFSNQRCAVQRDTIYSLLALCVEGPEIAADYTTTTEDVFMDVLRACRHTMCLCAVGIVAKA